MKIAVVGAGFAGLGVAWHLLKHGHQVTLFDEKGIGAGTSGIATGLLHPYVGEQARRSWRADDGLSHTLILLDIAEKALGHPVCNRQGILRYAMNDEQFEMLSTHEKNYRDIEKIDTRTFLIRSGITVDAPLYLQGLWLACLASGATLIQGKISCLEELSAFDRIVLAIGHRALTFSAICGMKASLVKGQVLLCKNPPETVVKSVIAKGYLAIGLCKNRYHLGATYERQFFTEEPSLEEAKRILLAQSTSLLPMDYVPNILDCCSGIRLIRQGQYVPYVDRVTQGVWVLGALGSRGLLYHAYLGSLLAHAIGLDRPDELPNEVRMT